MGPVDYLIVRFPGNRFSGEIIPELADLVQSGIIRVIDLVFIMRDGRAGELVKVEAKDLQGEMGNAYGNWRGTPTNGSPRPTSRSSRRAWPRTARPRSCSSRTSGPSASRKR